MASNVNVMRVVVRNVLSFDLAHLFLADLKRSVDYLETLSGPIPRDTATARRSRTEEFLAATAPTAPVIGALQSS